eukprot:gnl/Dysnectes_brevis/6684_a10557_626.p1 GENE.gnl/Dysnectes_brevis/6684_a10557_626~~gnl/Dysnectes_brevis/6684_a10557_626.p1  ORF type:complete len:201 (+),score=0.36 gnl/Dysnectes_brevis/6684_a10557_626:55-603(+)
MRAFEKHKQSCQEELSLVTFHPDLTHHTNRQRIIEEGRALEHLDGQGQSTALIAHSGVSSGVVTWSLRWERGSNFMFGVHPATVPSRFDCTLGYGGVRGIGLYSGGGIYSAGSASSYNCETIKSFKCPIDLKLCLDMEQRQVTFIVDGVGSYTTALVDDGAHVLAVHTYAQDTIRITSAKWE